MPHKAGHPCGHPGCAAVVPAGVKYCEMHCKLHKGEDIRPGRQHGNLYGTARWQRLRKQVLAAHPFCEECLKAGRYTKADTIDHIVPHRGNPDLFFEPGNLQALCKSCHDRKTWTEDSRPEYKY